MFQAAFMPEYFFKLCYRVASYEEIKEARKKEVKTLVETWTHYHLNIYPLLCHWATLTSYNKRLKKIVSYIIILQTLRFETFF